jgi:hypothetical protein
MEKGSLLRGNTFSYTRTEPPEPGQGDKICIQRTIAVFPAKTRPQESANLFPDEEITTIINKECAAPVQYRFSMAQSDAKIKYLENELDEQERQITMMESSGPGEDRIATLERKVREMEALVKGLTQELLDLKSIAMKMSKQTEERSRQELRRGPIVQGAQTSAPQSAPQPTTSASGTTVIRPKSSSMPAEPAEPAMDMIMQPDGTMKLEPRRGDKNYIVASAGYGRNKKGTSVKGKQSDLIYAAEEDKSDSGKK